jgi:penicillin-binding protein 2
MNAPVPSIARRQAYALAIVAVAVILSAAWLVKLQIVQHADLARQSEENRLRVAPIFPRRGIATDRNGKIVIDNRPSYTVSVVLAEEVPGVTLPNLSQLIGMDTAMIRRRILRNLVNRYQPAPVKRDVPFETVAVMEEQARRFPGVSYQMERVRQYQDGLGAETFTGHVGDASEDELQQSKIVGLRLGSVIGKKGLEKEYDQLTRGQEGTEYIEANASGQIIGKYKEKSPVKAIAGADLTLTIDNDLQQACAAALDTFCCGAIVVMDPRNGEILALTSYPGYDANIFSSVIPEDVWQDISNDPNHPLLNRPLKGLYPPGSTVKFVTLGAGLEERLVTANTTFKSCVGGYQFGNRFFRCWLESGHGILNAVHSIERSCDVYYYQLGIQLGIDKLSEYYAACGFGASTGIDLPGEEKGLNPNTDYYDRRYGEHQWSRGLVLNNSIGQGELLTTPLQLAQFFCGLANHGLVYRPHLVRKVTFADGRDSTVAPELSFQLPFSSATLNLLKEGIRLVVEGEHGTAKSLKNDLYSLGGKTGTAENPHGENHSWFVGVAPLENPEIVVCALMENAGHGSDVAAPLAGQIIEVYMRKALGLDLAAADDSVGDD